MGTRKIITATIIVLFLTGCGYRIVRKDNVSVLDKSYAAADALMKEAPSEIDQDTPLLVTSFPNIDNLLLTPHS